jgi:hypothetical protein
LSRIIPRTPKVHHKVFIHGCDRPDHLPFVPASAYELADGPT